MAAETLLMIGNRDVPATQGAVFERRSPLDGALASTASAASPEDAAKAADAAWAAFPAWSTTSPSERRALLNRAADLLEARADAVIATACAETGATSQWIAFNVKLSAGVFREAAALTTRATGQVIPSDKPGSLSLAVRRPAGVVLAIAPWNAPVILGVRAIATPLACGNTVVLKASEVCPATHRLIGEVCRDAGFPAGVVNVVTNAPADAPAVVERLIAHPRVRRVNFTGSSKVGRRIGELAAAALKPALLELGGKAPLVVLDDADIDGAVNAAAFGAYMNQGQICMSTERVVVQDAVADLFAESMARKARALNAAGVLGALVSAEAGARMQSLVDDAVARGARLLAGGEGGVTFQATVLDHVTADMRIYAEESFGPIAAIVRVDTVEAAIEVANDTEYGLSSAVFGRDLQRALAVAERIEAGICHINGPTVHDEAQMPFGGVKASGYGRFGGEAGISEFTDLRWITLEDPAQHYPF